MKPWLCIGGGEVSQQEHVWLKSEIPADAFWICLEAKDIKKRRQEYTEELYKKDLHDPDNNDGVITDLEPDILECEVKWALGSIIMNKVEVKEFQLC